MSKDGVKIPRSSQQVRDRDRNDAPSTNKQSLAKRLLDANKKKSADPKAKAQQPQRAQRQKAAHGAGGAHGAGAAQEEAGGAVGGEAGNVAGIDGGEGELHRRRHADAELNWAEAQELHEHHETDAQGETGAVGVDAIKRSKGGDTGGGDGFEGGKDQREAYEKYLKGNVKADKERFDELRSSGTKDDFRVDRPPKEVEALGIQRAAVHLVRLYDAWTLDGAARIDAIGKAATFLADFVSPVNIKKVLAELESKPIRDVYPLEVLMKMLDDRPELLPGVRSSAIVGNADELENGQKVFAGHAVPVHVPKDCRIKSFALLGGGRPGYEFYPTPNADDRYTLLVDTPGKWTFALLAAPLQALGKIQRETQEALLQLITVNVWAMGKKGEPVSAEEWLARAEEELDLAGDAPPDEDEAPSQEAAPAPNLAVQMRKMLDGITRDFAEPGAPASATTYSWECELWKPGMATSEEPILRVIVERAGPFDAAWHKARETIAAKQKEYEPSRAPLTQEDLTAAIRRARVRD